MLTALFLDCWAHRAKAAAVTVKTSGTPVWCSILDFVFETPIFVEFWGISKTHRPQKAFSVSDTTAAPL